MARIALCLMSSAFLLACGVHQEMSVPTSSPFASCRIDTYGWSRTMGLEQEIWVELSPGVKLGRVVDLSIFGSLRPGMNHKDALSVLGHPSRKAVDRWGETWFLYDRPSAVLRLGCSYESSGDTPRGCLWRLTSTLRTNGIDLLDPELARFIRIGVTVPETVKGRTLHVQTSGNTEFISYKFEGAGRGQLLWHDNKKYKWRTGAPRRQG